MLSIRNTASALSLALSLSVLSASAQTGYIENQNDSGVDLNSLFSPPTNTVINDDFQNNTAGGTDAVFGSAHQWNLSNNYYIEGADNGVHLTSGGSVYNGYFLSGGNNGVLISGSAGTVENSSAYELIGYTNNGVELDNGGTVINDSYAYLAGNTNGVLIKGGSGFVKNGYSAGIYGTINNGVELDAAGAVDNEGGTIQGNVNGVYITGGPGYVTNYYYGYITGSHEGVELNAGGGVFNTYLSTINGGNNGVEVNNDAGWVINDNSFIYGTNYNGIRFEYGGTVVQTNGTIIGGQNGIRVYNAPGYVENNGGLIQGLNNDGVLMHAGGAVFNTNEATILGNVYGVDIGGGFGVVTNINSHIYGNGRSGVRLRDGGIVDNDGSFSEIGGNHDGVHISGDVGTVYNLNGALIVGHGDNGIQMDDGGYVNNGNGDFISGGSIGGLHDGVRITGASGQVDNNGTITATNHAGVYMDSSGTVYNYSYGTIKGGDYGVEMHGTGIPAPQPSISIPNNSQNAYVANYGTIIGETRSGVRFWDGGYVYNDGDYYGYGPGIIHGATDGVHITGGSGEVDNQYGDITGDSHSGVHMTDAGSVYNYGGNITGGDYGVEIAGTVPLKTGGLSSLSAYVYNGESGNISGTNRAGIRFRNGGNVDNYGNVYGGTEGIHITGGAANIYNAGHVTGNNGTAILLDSFNDTVTLDTGSHFDGNVDAGDGFDGLVLDGSGSEGNNFTNFEYLVMQGNHWTLTGSNGFSQDVNVGVGLLSIGTNGVGVLASPLITITTNGGLGGFGTIIGTVDNHGSLQPGNSIGTQTIIGDYTNGGNYYAQVDAKGNGDNLNVSGTTTITGGAVVIQPGYGLYGASTIYSILTSSNGIVGAFSGADIEPEFWPGFALFLTNSALRNIGDTNIQFTLTRIPFKSVARTYNQRAVAGAFDKMIDQTIAGNNPGMSNVLTSFFWDGSAAEARADLDSMSGEIHGTAGMLDGQQQDMFNHAIALRTGRLSTGDAEGGYASTKPTYLATTGSAMPAAHHDSEKPWDVWGQGVGNWGHLDGDGNAVGGNFTMDGFSGGIDYRVNQSLLIGLAVGYTHDDINAGVDNSSAKVDAIQFGGYASYVNGPWHFDGIVSYGMLNTKTKRFAFVDDSFEGMPKANYDGGVISLSAEGGYDFALSKHITFQPSLGIIYNHLDQDSFKEKNGGALGLDVKSVSMDSFRSDLNLKLAGNWGKPDGVRFQPDIHAGWQHEFADRTASVDEQFLGDSTGTKFTVRGVQLGTETFTLGAGVNVPFNRTITAFLNYDAHLNDQLTAQTVSGGISIGW